MKIDKAARIRRAEELFVAGYNCSQSVVAALPTSTVIQKNRL